ncbi:orotate phosphoribosyltransferase [Aureobasidium pullulans]|uniref:Orotate phosphoribosyltransferase n=1 Tax=Aureobasidium pullulans TaxID=5580 RepID=A0A4S9B498_AURPU|nr:orotate phosphoribosyltransferase [Aureobasidium pullulans]
MCPHTCHICICTLGSSRCSRFAAVDSRASSLSHLVSHPFPIHFATPPPPMSSAEALPAYKRDLISLTLSSNILTFGSFTLKSGRISPYFFNCGLFSKGKLIRGISEAYARTVAEYCSAHPEFKFDVLFGPAYKGIPLCATTAEKLAGIDEEKYGDLGFVYNRKEVKDHGEGGLMVGESLKGKKVVVIDDVMTAGTAIREAISIIKSQGGELVGIIVALDRQEKTPSEGEKQGKPDDGSDRPSTIGQVREETGVPVLAVLTLDDVIEGVKGQATEEQLKGMEDYKKKYGASS